MVGQIPSFVFRHCGFSDLFVLGSCEIYCGIIRLGWVVYKGSLLDENAFPF